MVVHRGATDGPARLGRFGRSPRDGRYMVVHGRRYIQYPRMPRHVGRPGGFGLAPHRDRPIGPLRDEAVVGGGNVYVSGIGRVVAEGLGVIPVKVAAPEKAPGAQGAVGVDAHPAGGGRIDR